jgi:hypothetical protein
MDITTLTDDITNTLVPVLPYLLKAGETAAGEAGKKLSGAAWEGVKKLWGMLRPKMEAKPAALEAAHEAANAPDDQDAHAALRFQLKKLLTEDKPLAEEINQWWERAKGAGIAMTIQGDRNIAVGDRVNKSTLITGDQNVVKGD